MTFFSSLSFKFRMLLCVTISLLIFGAAMAYKASLMVIDAYAYGVNVANVSAVRLIVNELEDEFSGLSHSGSQNASVESLTWDDMPDDVDDDRLDAVRSVSGLHATVFRWNPETQDFIRDATTIETAPGQRAVGTPMARGVVYDAMVAGETFVGEVDILGQGYVTYYHPVRDSAGNTVSVFFSGYPDASLMADARSSLILSAAISSLVLALILMGTFFFVARSLRPLNAATQSIVNLSRGNLDDDISFTDRKDEIGQISQSLLVLQASMQEAAELKITDAEKSEEAAARQRDQAIVVEALTEGLGRLGNLDLTTHIESDPNAPFPAEYEGLRTSFNMLVDNLSESVEAIREVADEVNQDAREMASSSQDLSGRTEKQAATLEESAAALEELSASIQSTAKNASDAEANTSENRAVAKRTGDIVETAISAMAAIEESSRKITQIISVIDDIAFQTNLLALNAGVEAARAGDAGRGFAVVASEVRALAQHSSASAQEIKALIASSSEQVENGSKLVRNAGDSIGDIVSRVDRVASLVSDIALSAKEQSIGVTEINTGVRELDSATQRNAAMAEEASAASESLTAAADRLANQLARFQVSTAPMETNWTATAVGHDVPSAMEVAIEAEAFAPRAPARAAPDLDMGAQADVFRDF
ncbi:methyl-accepting chemotaxis protein [Rhodobacteraceae bacterium N5(2021)]|uniref:Methyl-accepting chemotaxis protein n=1 Tax=Gymnodinialimonas phycosphaerae TaxID=2841589 RepID=A0A975TY46_9RHOB|nr:methyl-accepting chemotaxis protein [Gymnodinialimonas phycosphaerae]MBY4893153.1 methyl-accepting chemotaxis protein [Gymnodinialimonas phycosphaerae]